MASGTTVANGTGYVTIADATSDFIAIDTSTTGISKPASTDNSDVNTPAYNLSGQRVNSSYHGIIIRSGKKYINR